MDDTPPPVSAAPAPGWGPFGRSPFPNPAARALARLGVVDVGSNSVRLVVFDGAARSPAYFFNEKVLCGLGRGLAETGRLNPDGRLRALSALTRFRELGEAMDLPPLNAVATAAVREAADGPEFCDEVLARTGIRLHVIDGATEAQLSAEGVLLGWPEAQGLVCDLGGASMEMAEVAGGEVGSRASTPLGPLKLMGLEPGPALESHISRAVAALAGSIGTRHRRLFLVGGSWRAIARIDMLRRNYPLTVLHEYRMNLRDLRATIDMIGAADLEQLSRETATSMARLTLVPAAARVLFHLVRAFNPRTIAVSSYGIREGLLWRQMPEELRRRDPLIEACRFAEMKDARLPGFGARLFRFLQPVFPALATADRRLMQAACLLHDVSWRANPDYRHEVTFENATRANLGGLTHRDRVFIGLALLHRYKNSRDGWHGTALLSLLSPRDIRLAETLGKAMRFGAMFAVADPDSAGALRFLPRRKALELTLSPRGRALYGEVARTRLESLAAALGAEILTR